MALPKIQYPIFSEVVPSTGEQVKFRPFLVKEEKILLIAQQSDDREDQIDAITQILNNCITSPIKIDDLPIFDIEYLFLKIRSKSVNNIIDLRYQDTEDEQVYDFQLDLDEIKIIVPKDKKNTIAITDDIGIVMKYPSFKAMKRFATFDATNPEHTMEIIAKCVDKIYDADTVYPASEYTIEDLKEFISNLRIDQMAKVYEFFEAMPKLTHTFEYTNKTGKDRKIVLEGISDFFQ